MSETVSLDDMRIFARVAEAMSFTRAATALGMPKQTVSRRIAALERSLDAELLHRTTRRIRLTDVGAVYAQRCAEVVRLAEEAHRAISDDRAAPRGTLRVTADPVFGEAFLSGLVVEYARRWSEVQVEVVLTRRRVDLIEEGFDVAFRVGQGEEGGLAATRLGRARVRYCASPGYLRRHGVPGRPEDLGGHDCIVVAHDVAPMRWPFRGPRGVRMVPVTGRLHTSSFAMAQAAARAGLGIAIFPEFACATDVERGRLVPVLEAWTIEVGSIWLVHPAQRRLSPRLAAFVALTEERLGARPPWEIGSRRT